MVRRPVGHAGRQRLAWRAATTGAVLGTAPALTRASHVACAPDGSKAIAYGYGLEVWDTRDCVGRKLGDSLGASAAWGPGDRVAVGFEDAVEILAAGDEQTRA